jgi:hypothetical protein
VKNIISKKAILKFSIILLSIVVISWIYVFLTLINPIIYLDAVIWIMFGTTIFFCIQFLKIEHRVLKLFIGFILSMFALYVSYGINITYFYISVNDEINRELNTTSLTFNELKNTFFSIHEYYNRLKLFLNFGNIEISKLGGSNGIVLDATFLNWLRLIECLGILMIPIFKLYEARELYSANPKAVEGLCIHCKKSCKLTHDQRKDIIHYDCPRCGKYSY